MKKLYFVKLSTGGYSDYKEELVGVYKDKEKAIREANNTVNAYVEEHEFCDLVCLDTNDLDNDIL